MMGSLPSAATTVRDILCFHKLDRSIYDKLLSLGMQPVTARNVTALWMWLELIGIDVIANVRDNRDPTVVASFAAEAELILDYIRQDAPAVNDAAVATIPLTAGLVDEPLTLRFFHAHRDVTVRGITNILDGVGVVIFDDRLNALMAAQEVAARAAEEGGYRPPAVPVELCAVYRPRLVHASEDRRSMFVTFSKGYPLRREDIMEYFTQKWGDCVERVMMEKTVVGMLPMYGRIVFKSESFIGLVLNGEQLEMTDIVVHIKDSVWQRDDGILKRSYNSAKLKRNPK
ncbi:hypothetical protein HPP92_025305 [Vanilla planifolia]|uniref:Uncharacterized protein n=1 Tax=Vanilla planifolia TaxID=51239 RepID=A0A835UC68_VANPL|nr:hypothetical protein HPP92_025305 [Vanilla planifolia]